LRNQERFFAKNLINQTFGRLAVNSLCVGYEFKRQPDILAETSRNDFYEMCSWGDFAIIGYKNSLKRDTYKNTAAVAIIASRARIKLYNTLKLFDEAGIKVLAVNTDSIATKHKPSFEIKGGV
jgi:hypothetical protein